MILFNGKKKKMFKRQKTQIALQTIKKKKNSPLNKILLHGRKIILKRQQTLIILQTIVIEVQNPNIKDLYICIYIYIDVLVTLASKSSMVVSFLGGEVGGRSLFLAVPPPEEVVG